MGLFFNRYDYDDNEKYFIYTTEDGKIFFGHYRNDPEWLLHEYFTGVSMNILLRGALLEFNPEPFNGDKTTVHLAKDDGIRELTPKEFNKMISMLDANKMRKYFKKYLGIKYIQKDPELIPKKEESKKEDTSYDEEEFVCLPTKDGKFYIHRTITHMPDADPFRENTESYSDFKEFFTKEIVIDNYYFDQEFGEPHYDYYFKNFVISYKVEGYKMTAKEFYDAVKYSMKDIEAAKEDVYNRLNRRKEIIFKAKEEERQKREAIKRKENEENEEAMKKLKKYL